ncbi:Uncharacterised protein [Mycobacteroides abscessus subsp. abscessus]|nr:Uncharacterised protein [Mycobacteroides abscessus subsp. abscessus]
MRLVEDEDELGLVDVAHLGQELEQVGQDPHEERGEQHRVGGLVSQLEQCDDAAAVRREPQQVLRIELGLTEERIAACRFEIRQCTQNDSRGLRGDAADRLEFWLTLVAGQVGDHRPDVFEVEQGQPVLVGPVEDQAQRRFLSFVESQHLAEQNRPEGSDGRAYRHPDPLRSE